MGSEEGTVGSESSAGLQVIETSLMEWVGCLGWNVG